MQVCIGWLSFFLSFLFFLVLSFFSLCIDWDSQDFSSQENDTTHGLPDPIFIIFYVLCSCSLVCLSPHVY